MSISNEHAEIDLSRKFGALPSGFIVRLCKEHSTKLGSVFMLVHNVYKNFLL